MQFSSDISYRRLDSAKYGCTEANGGEQTNQDDTDDQELVGYSLDFNQPKNSFMSELGQGCGKMRQTFANICRFAFGKWPISLCILICYTALTVGLIVIALTGRYHEFRSDISLNSFVVPDIKVSSDYTAFNTAKKKDKKNTYLSFDSFLISETCTRNNINPIPSHDYSQRLKRSFPEKSNIQSSLSWTLDLVYIAKNGNVFTKENLAEIHRIEQALMKQEGYDKHCFISKLFENDKSLRKYGKCSPPNSMIDFFYPSENGEFADGLGESLIRPISETLQYLQSKEYFFAYVSDDFSVKNGSRILRAQLLFGRPVEGISSSTLAQKEEFKKFIRTYVDTLEKLNNNNQVSVLYGGGDLFDYLVNRALISDIHLAAISLGLIILLLLILTFSWWLSLMAVFTICSSVAFAYFFYRVAFGMKYMGILNGVSLFVIIGIGVDDIFVFINTFRQAVDNKDLGNRIYHTICVAGKATFFTSFTTACAFGANALSPIPAIHDFGLFMAILVASCWVSVLFIMSPALTLWHAGLEKLESSMCSKVLMAIGVRRSECFRLPADIRSFLSGVSRSSSDNQISEVEAIPLTRTNNDDADDDDDVPLLVPDNEALPIQTINVADSIGFRLQSILYHFVAEPVIKGRVVIIVTYFFFIVGCAFLLSKLKVSTEQPKFFKANSNLQQWLELPEVSLKDGSSAILKDIMNFGPIAPTIPSITGTDVPSKRHTQSQTHSKAISRPTTSPFSQTRPPPLTKPRTSATRKHVQTTKPPATGTPITQETTKGQTSVAVHPKSTIKTSQRADVFPTNPKGTTLSNRYRSTHKPTDEQSVKPESPCPDCFNGGVCNNVTSKCDCQFPFIGETCAQSCPIKTLTGKCCMIPFTHGDSNALQYGCLIEPKTEKAWCRLRQGGKGYCNMTVAKNCTIRTQTPDKTCCHFPYFYNSLPYFSCIPKGKKGLFCGVTPHVSSSNELVKCEQQYPLPLCPGGSCVRAEAPPNEATAVVYLVFGIKGIDKTSIDLRHVLKETEADVIYNKAFSKEMSCDTLHMVKSACSICRAFSSNTKLVKTGGAECFPKHVQQVLEAKFPDECYGLPQSKKHNKIKSILVLDNNSGQTRVKWFAMAFSSTTGKLASYGSQHKDYRKWEDQLQEVLKDAPDSLKSGFQTSETWVKMFSGVIVVDSAIYGIAVSLLLCLAAVIIFTGHLLLFLILFFTILGVLLMVTGIFYLTGWQLGGVEAISLSILVGTSVDYCFHLVEGYILAGEAVDPTLSEMAARQWRAKAAMAHIGMSIISSAITTILAAIPLCLTQIQLFAKFGLIVTINTGISLLYTVTVTMAMLSLFGPARFRGSFIACVIGFTVVCVLGGLATVIMYLISTQGGHCIDSPSGKPLFKCD